MENDKSRSRHKSNSAKKRPRSNFDNGKRKRQNSRQDDLSVSSKPIETMYRILCPVKKIGSVLGRGGDIITALREETRAKIRVADAISGAEERVIIIFNYQPEQPGERGSDEAAEDAVSKDDGAGDMKPNCPAQDALLKIHDRIAADEVLHGGVVAEKDDPDEAITARILVPNNQIGCLLGKGGTIIQQLRTDTGAGIRIMPSDHLPPCAMRTDELVQMSGTPSLVRKALYEISTKLHQHPRKEHPPLEDIIHASTQGINELPPPLPQGNPSLPPYQYGRPPPPVPWYDGFRNEPSGYAPGYSGSRSEAEEFSVRLLCASGRIGGVIGKGGANVRQLENETGASIQVEDTDTDAGERIIVISSKEIPSDPISPTIEALLLLQGKTSIISEKGVVTSKLLIPSSKVGCIIGEGGKIIAEMRRRTRAEIRVFSQQDKPKYISADQELVQVSGNPHIAKEALTEIASRLRTRTFRGGSSAMNPPPPPPFRGLPPSDRLPSREFPREFPPYGRSVNNPPDESFRSYPSVDYYSNRDLPPSRSPAVNNAPPASYRGYATIDRMSGREFPSSESPALNTTSSGSYRGYAHPESYSSRGSQSFGLTRAANSGAYNYTEAAGHMYGRPGYLGPSTSAGYSSSSVEVRIPTSALESVIGVGGSNLSEIRQISGARVKLHDARPGSSECIVEIHGTADQMKAAQSLLQAFISTNSQNLPPSQSNRYQSSVWS